jgi:hypothetical protein
VWPSRLVGGQSLRRALQVKPGVQRALLGTESLSPNDAGGGVPGRESARSSPWARVSSRCAGGAVINPGQAQPFSLRRRRAQFPWRRAYDFVKSERLSAIGKCRGIGLQAVAPTGGRVRERSIRIIGRQGVSSAGGHSRTKQAAVEQRDAPDKARRCARFASSR